MMYDVIIIGSGPAGLTAAIYTTRANLKTLIVAGSVWGGQLMLTSIVENYPGFPDGIQGPELMMAMRKQAERHGAEVMELDFQEGDFSQKPFVVKANNKTFTGRSVIIATGANVKWLDVPGEKGFIGKGVSSCATCDAPFFRGKNVIVVGGGDTAVDDALVLAKTAASVSLVHRRETLRASNIMQQRIFANPKIQFFWNYAVSEIKGGDKVTAAVIKNIQTGETKELAVDGVFVAIGQTPNTTVFKGIKLDDQGYILVNDHTKTNVPGVFVAGDVHDAHYKQAITAAGMGCMAALDTERWLSEQKQGGEKN
ncbi:thioredoxin-disulfide reductase [Candidatus Microgenomates bacterium]|nr:thioredoxin-disulfide reductase [Candidatus Microgenomates bacterium]